jgi:hypothetical protein
VLRDADYLLGDRQALRARRDTWLAPAGAVADDDGDGTGKSVPVPAAQLAGLPACGAFDLNFASSTYVVPRNAGWTGEQVGKKRGPVHLRLGPARGREDLHGDPGELPGPHGGQGQRARPRRHRGETAAGDLDQAVTCSAQDLDSRLLTTRSSSSRRDCWVNEGPGRADSEPVVRIAGIDQSTFPEPAFRPTGPGGSRIPRPPTERST